MDTPDTDCVGNTDATLQMQGYTFCVYPTFVKASTITGHPAAWQRGNIFQWSAYCAEPLRTAKLFSLRVG